MGSAKMEDLTKALNTDATGTAWKGSMVVMSRLEMVEAEFELTGCRLRPWEAMVAWEEEMRRVDLGTALTKVLETPSLHKESKNASRDLVFCRP